MAFTNALHHGKSTISSKVGIELDEAAGSANTAQRASEYFVNVEEMIKKGL